MTAWRAGSRYVTITVELQEPLERFTRPGGRYRRAFEQALRGHLSSLLDDLTIPAETSLEVERWQHRQGLPVLNSYKVTVNGQPCRLPLPTVVSKDVDAPELALSVYQAVHQNRALVLSLPLARSIRRAWRGETDEPHLPNLTDEQFRESLAALIQQGLAIERVNRSVQNLAERTPVDWAPERLFEETAAGLDKVGIKVYLEEAQHRLVTGPGEAIEEALSPDEASLGSMLDMMRDGLFYELGLMLPMVDIVRDEGLDRDSFQFQFNDLRFPPQQGLEEDECLVNDTVDRLMLLKVSGRKATNPANGSESAVIRNQDGAVERCEQGGLTTWDAAGYLVLALSAAIRQNAGLFINADVVRFMLYRLRDVFPGLVDAVERQIPIHDLTRILRGLLDEELSIRDLRGILEPLLAMAGQADGSRAPDWSRDGVSAVRRALNRYVSHKYTRGSNTIVAVLLDHDIETRLMQDPPLDEGERHRLLASVFGELGGLPPTAQNQLVLTRIECRKKLRNLIAREFPQVAVLCYQDLSPDMNIQPMGRISWSR